MYRDQLDRQDLPQADLSWIEVLGIIALVIIAGYAMLGFMTDIV